MGVENQKDKFIGPFRVIGWETGVSADDENPTNRIYEIRAPGASRSIKRKVDFLLPYHNGDEFDIPLSDFQLLEFKDSEHEPILKPLEDCKFANYVDQNTDEFFDSDA